MDARRPQSPSSEDWFRRGDAKVTGSVASLDTTQNSECMQANQRVASVDDYDKFACAFRSRIAWLRGVESHTPALPRFTLGNSAISLPP